MLYTFQNKEQKLVSTNFWSSPEAADGQMFLTWNAGVGRLLVPVAIWPTLIPEIGQATSVEIEELADRICLYFYDSQPDPYLVQIGLGMTDRNKLAKGKTRIDIYAKSGIHCEIEAVIV